MNPFFGGPGMAGLDPSKLKPETLMKLTRLVQELPPPMIMKMQSLMHNAMAGLDVRKEMEAFEKSLPAGFREKMAGLLYEAHGVVESSVIESPSPQTEIEARMTILRAVSSGTLTPDEAYKVLFET
jgi:hypothetical protein